MILSEISHSVRVLKAQGYSLREISRLLKLSRNTVRRILRGQERAAAASSPCDAQTLSRLEDAFRRANVVRVQQLLADENELEVSYSTLTRWIRAAGLRSSPRRSGEYRHAPGAEAQHETSPHRVVIAGKPLTAQCAGLVLAYSRRLYVQYYPNLPASRPNTSFSRRHGSWTVPVRCV
jgi:transposase